MKYHLLHLQPHRLLQDQVALSRRHGTRGVHLRTAALGEDAGELGKIGLGLGLGLWLERQRGSVTQLITEWYTDGPIPLQVYYYKSPRHGKHYVLSFPFCFDRKDARKEEVYYFAYCFPYTYSYLQRFLFALESKQLPFLQRDCLCRSLQERRLDLLTISSPAYLILKYGSSG